MKHRLSEFLTKSYTLLTGATGLVGRYLMRDLLLRGHRLAVIVRASKKQCVRARIESILRPIEAQLGLCLPRPVICEGDVTKPDLGLNEADLRWIEKNCDRMIHSAATLEFNGVTKDGEPWRTNVQGTRNVLKVCEKVGIKEMHYISTAYVCGNRSDLVLEEELDKGQDFRNDYERSKFEAEKLVRAADFLDELTVYRPAVIAGDSETGYTSTYHGLHLYLRLMAMMVPVTEPDEKGVRHTEIRLPMQGDEPRNIVPVDWVARVFCEIYENLEAHGRTFHLVPEQPTTPRHIVESGYRYFNSTGVKYVGGQEFSVDDNNNFEANFLSGVAKYQAYDQTDPKFGDENIKRFAGHFACPSISEETIHRYLEYGQKDKWGKRRRPKIELGTVAEDYFPAVCRVASQFIKSEVYTEVQRPADSKPLAPSAKDLVIGLDVIGPGGGQWTLVANAAQGATITRGLPERQPPILQLEIGEFIRMFGFSTSETQQSAVEHISNRFAYAVFAKALAHKN